MSQPRALLAGQLQNHWLAAAAGEALFRRVARTHSDPEVAAAVAKLSEEVTADREALRRIMLSLGVRPSEARAVLGRGAELLGRVKPNGRVVSRSPLTDVLELEGLRTAVAGKRSGWQVLKVLAKHDGGIDIDLVEDLLDRADAQLDELEHWHLRIARAVFTVADSR